MPDRIRISGRRMSLLQAVLAIALSAAVVDSGLLFAADGGVDYQQQIKPLLRARCYACHGSLKQEGGLRLDTAALLKMGGDSGEAIFPGEEAAASLLLERIATKDVSYRMPPEHEGEPFNTHEIDLIRKWIAGGAQSPEDEQPEADVSDHWSFQPIEKAPLPEVSNTQWVRNPIDRWIAAGHESQDLQPQPEAPRIVLVRRLYLDLIGVPPTAEQIAAAEADTSDDWYEKIVDRLLEDPRYGERWARHWMDVWRYSDWWGLGNQLRNSQKHMWHWRDWIVESLNEDQPYDEMVCLMLAADEIAPNDLDKLRATGFLARNYFIFNRDKWMDETVTHVGKGFLGLTLNCAKCHDHKFDPIPQTDYYRMRAFFEPYHIRMDMVPGTTSFAQDGIPRAFDGSPDDSTFLFIRGNEAQPDKSHPISPGVPEVAAFEEIEIQPVELPEEAWQPGLRSWVLENHRKDAQSQLATAQAQRDEAASQLNATQETPEPPAIIFDPIVETFTTLDRQRWQVRGEGWQHTAGKLQQNSNAPVRSEITLLEEVPRDFEVVLQFKIVGGTTYRSVGIDFDVPGPQSGEQDSYSFVYISGHSSAGKVQGAFSQDGSTHYPPEGRRSYSVELNQPYTLLLRVRDGLVNAVLNDKLVLAWRTPVERHPGAIRLMTYDAVAEITHFELTALDPASELTETSGKPTVTTRETFDRAVANLTVTETYLSSVEQRIAAIESRQKQEAAEKQEKLRIAAIRAEQHYAVALARREVLVAEQNATKAPQEKATEAEKQLASARKKLKEELAKLDSEVASDATFTLFQGAEWSATRFKHTGHDDPTLPFPATSTGRRTALAEWITDRRNPLTARVAVNHLWGRHFGTPLATSPFDLGRNSPTPTHAKLIDWLAAEFMEHGWSMKHLHRLIVTSATYRMSSSRLGAEKNIESDSDNLYLWHRQPLRMESQLVRDAILSLAGTLDSTMGGPSIPPGQQEDSHRRSLYFFHSNNERNLFLSTFDEAEVTECYRRDESIVPQQALAMTNSKLVLESAPLIAKQLSESAETEQAFLQTAFAVVLGIHPTSEEIEASHRALEELQELPESTTERARAQLIWILLNHNDFVTVR
ncbi:DUF1553 domain-containing protein [Bremerella cremea]|uniref:DUF1553 domain-containing protein n=1 Tax=Bremerella cremea TaxID=1031537 RepID=A0A368KVM3_9BACT|nr:PSD1 and planctomycete cytochrome C domain-containing protein [Bremerella cremea]RCS54480.1 DUF1553 domain-containing protein [Bremerella cremea]